MTKRVRVENADTSTFEVEVQTWNKGGDGQPDTMESSRLLKHPADIADFWIHATKYLVVKEPS